MENGFYLPEPVNQNIYEMNREEREAVGIQDLPSTLYTALKAMRENDTGFIY
jgi:glutamine synthetase